MTIKDAPEVQNLYRVSYHRKGWKRSVKSKIFAREDSAMRHVRDLQRGRPDLATLDFLQVSKGRVHWLSSNALTPRSSPSNQHSPTGDRDDACDADEILEPWGLVTFECADCYDPRPISGTAQIEVVRAFEDVADGARSLNLELSVDADRQRRLLVILRASGPSAGQTRRVLDSLGADIAWSKGETSIRPSNLIGLRGTARFVTGRHPDGTPTTVIQSITPKPRSS